MRDAASCFVFDLAVDCLTGSTGNGFGIVAVTVPLTAIGDVLTTATWALPIAAVGWIATSDWCYNHSMPSVPLTVCPTCLARVTSLIVDFATQRRFCQECATTSPNAVRVARKIHEHNMRGTLDEYPIEERLRDLQSDADSPEGLADTPHT